MEKYQNRENPRLQGYDYSTPGAYFLTLCTHNGQCLLSHIVGTGVPDGPYSTKFRHSPIRLHLQTVLQQRIREKYMASPFL